MYWSKLLKKKLDHCNTMITFMNQLKTKRFEVKHLKCPSAFENMPLEQVLKKLENQDLYPSIRFEYIHCSFAVVSYHQASPQMVPQSTISMHRS